MANNGTDLREMRFACDQSWENMAPVEGGRFCDSCQRPVIDFTTWRKDELQAWFRAGAQGCGRFEVHQLDPSLVPIEEVGRGMRRGLFAAIAAFAIGSAQAQEVEPTDPTEQVDSLTQVREAGVNARVAAAARNPKLERETCPPIAPPPPLKEKKRTYISWRWPFVHRYTVGRRRMGFF